MDRVKVVIVGVDGCGKTTLALTFFHGAFPALAAGRTMTSLSHICLKGKSILILGVLFCCEG